MDTIVQVFGPELSHQRVAMDDRDFDGAGYSDTIKCTGGLTDCTITLGVVKSGGEDALDVNNLCSDLDVTAKLWVLRGSMGITIKGGSQNVRVAGEVDGHGRECDVDLGNASDQSHAWTLGTRLNLWRKDGSPVRVRVLAAELPIEEPGSGPYVYVFPWKWAPFRVLVVRIFLQLRRMGFLKQK